MESFTTFCVSSPPNSAAGKGLLVNIFGGIMKCDTIAEGIVIAAKCVLAGWHMPPLLFPHPEHFPLTLRVAPD